MATQKAVKPETTLATVQTGGAMARPSFLGKGDTRGTENITKDDMVMPRLALAQGLTPQVTEGKDGFAVGVLFNSLTEQIYGRGPIDFTVLRADKPRWVEFTPMDEGGGMVDPNVPAGDPRTQFTTGPDGESVPPIATKFYDFIVLMLPVNDTNPMESVIALSFKSTGLKVAKKLNGFMKLRNAASFAGKYQLTTSRETNSKGTFAVYEVQNAGWVSEDEYRLAELLYDGLKDKAVVIDRGESGADEGTDFPHGANAGDSGM